MGHGTRMDPTVLAQAIISGLMQGGAYALVSIGLTLIFGVMRIINFAHGEFLMLAFFGCYFLSRALGIEPYLTALFVLPGMGLFGFFIFRVIVSPNLRVPYMNQALLLIGLSLFVQNLALLVFSPDYRLVNSAYMLSKFHMGPVVVSLPRFVAFVGSLSIVGFLYWVIQSTDLGRSFRAVAQDREAAALNE